MDEEKQLYPPEELEFEHEAYSGVGPTFLEKLLSALIIGHELQESQNNGDATSTDARRKNLQKALSAITGRKVRLRKGISAKEAAACKFIAEQIYADECKRTEHLLNARLGKPVGELEPSVRSIRQLSRLATEKFFGADVASEVGHNQAERLRELVDGRYQRKVNKSDKSDHMATWKYLAVEHDYLSESLEHQDLEEICQILERNGVPVKLGSD